MRSGTTGRGLDVSEERYDSKLHSQHTRSLSALRARMDATEAEVRQFRAVVEMIVEHGLERTRKVVGEQRFDAAVKAMAAYQYALTAFLEATSQQDHFDDLKQREGNRGTASD
jgi:hypothetical protein